MTSKQVFEYALIELNKREAPSLLLEDYNYFINKAVNQYINKIYNAYDVNQQKSDDLRVLKASAVLTPTLNNDYATAPSESALFSKAYELDLPDDYLHILNCIVEYDVAKYYKCYNQGDKVHFGAKRLTADMFSQILNNYYLRPLYKNPYFYINNVTTTSTYPTSDTQTEVIAASYKVIIGTVDATSKLTISLPTGVTTVTVTTASALISALNALTTPTVIATLSGSDVLVTDANVGNVSVTGKGLTLDKVPSSTRISENRYGNSAKVRMEIRYGKDSAIFTLSKVYIDYLKSPKFIRLSQSEIDKVEDTSQILEFPDYVCQEVVNELVRLLMENASDPRLQSHIPINQSIAQPGQEQPQQAQRK